MHTEQLFRDYIRIATSAPVTVEQLVNYLFIQYILKQVPYLDSRFAGWFFWFDLDSLYIVGKRGARVVFWCNWFMLMIARFELKMEKSGIFVVFFVIFIYFFLSTKILTLYRVLYIIERRRVWATLLYAKFSY
jgi:hypothetical protein